MSKPLRFLVVTALLVSSGIFVATPSNAATLPPLGVQASTLSKVSSYEAWLGREVTHVTDYVEGTTWAQIRQLASERTSVWRGSRFRAVYSLMPFPASGSFAAGNAGHYDADLLAVAQTMAANDPDAIIRPGWELNGDWFWWSANPDPAAFASYFRRIVDIFRSVPGQQFQFEWNVSLRPVATSTAAYPGDAHVDIIGLDVYDSSWGPLEVDPVQRWNAWLTYPTGLNYHRDFAIAHGKQISFSEWGVSPDHYGGANPDNPYFIQKFHDWLVANQSLTAYSVHFDTINHQGSFSLSQVGTPYPNAANLFRQLFGTGQSAPPTTPPPTSPPPTAPPPTSPPPTAPPPTSPPTTSPPATVPPFVGTDGSVCSANLNPPSNPSASSAAGYWILGSNGAVHSFGGAPHYGDLVSRGLQTRAVSIESTSTGRGYWILEHNNRVHAFGDAANHGDPSGLDLVADVVQLAGDPNSSGYWVATADGGIFSYGAPFRGSLGATALAAPVIAMGATNRGDGYWMVGSDGGVFALGAAGFLGSMGGVRLDAPVISMASSPNDGYWLYAADGGVFAFGAGFHGSIPGLGLCNSPVAVQLRATQTGNGYWILASDGYVFAFGDAQHYGHLPNLGGVSAVDMAVFTG